MNKFRLPQKLEELDIQAQRLWQGAVCTIICENHLIFIQRSLHMPSHSGQIGFFGGNKKTDELQPIQTAQREFLEETSLSNFQMQYLGLLPPVYTSLNKIFIPVVFEAQNEKVDDFFNCARSNGEWDHLFAVPLHLFLDFSRWSYGDRIGNRHFPIYFFNILKNEYRAIGQITPHDKLLWGATGRMVFELISLYSK